MAWLIGVGVLGLVLGWLIRGRSSPSQHDLADYEARAQRAERRLRSVVVERDAEHASVATLRAALRSERQLLDGVANQSGVEPESFRKTIAREYLGRELVVSPASLVDFDFGTNTAAEAEVVSLQRLLRAKDAQLSEAREQIHRIRADVESLALAGPAARHQRTIVAEDPTGESNTASATGDVITSDAIAGGTGSSSEATIDVRGERAVIDLCEPSIASVDQTQRPSARRPDRLEVAIDATKEPAAVSPDHVRFLESRAATARMLEEEVASLRARLADTAVASDDIRSRIEYRRSLDTQLGEIVSQLDALHQRALAEKPALVPEEGSDAVL